MTPNVPKTLRENSTSLGFSFLLKTRPHIWPLVYDYGSLESKVYLRL